MATPELKRSPQGKLLVATCSWNLHGRRCWDEADVLQGTPSVVKDLIKTPWPSRNAPRKSNH